MKLFHISDLHIGLKLMNHDLTEDQKYVHNQIIAYAKKEKPEAILIAGDVYDKAIPSAEAVELFDDFLSELHEQAPESEIMIISGNHDSAPRLDIFRSILSKQRVHMIGMPPMGEDEHIARVTLKDEYGDVDIYLLPFVRPSMIKAIVGVDENGNNFSYDESVRRLLAREQIDTSKRNVLVSHQFYLPAGKTADDVERMDSEIRMVGNIDQIKSDVLAVFDYAALGHIHKPMKVGNEFFRYCGSTLACSISEAGQQKGVILVELGAKGDKKTTVLPLEPLHAIRVIKGSFEEVLTQGCEDYVKVVLTDKIDLDVVDRRENLRNAFPNLLEITREGAETVRYDQKVFEEEKLDVFELCSRFLGDVEEQDSRILQEIIIQLQERGA